MPEMNHRMPWVEYLQSIIKSMIQGAFYAAHDSLIHFQTCQLRYPGISGKIVYVEQKYGNPHMKLI